MTKIWAYACASTLLGALGQLLFRFFARKQETALWFRVDVYGLPQDWAVLGLGISCYLLAVGLWIQVLKSLPLSRVYPFLSLGYPLVYVGAVVWLGESLTAEKTLGTLMVCVGVWLTTGRSIAPLNKPQPAP